MQLSKEMRVERAEAKAALIAAAGDYDAAKAALFPDAQPAAPTADERRVDGYFEPCDQFAGGRPGWVFKRGPHGTGYYREGGVGECCAGNYARRG